MPLNPKTSILLLLCVSLGAFVVARIPDAHLARGSASQSAATIEAVLEKARPVATTSETAAHPTPAPELIAESAAVFDPLTSSFLLEKNSDTPLGIASLTKIMTAFVALERSGDDDIVPISGQAVATEGATGNLRAGEHFKMRELLKIMLMESSNDAAVAVAEYVGRKNGGESFEESQRMFVTLMNQEAESIGMDKTIFLNPIGLDTGGQKISNTSTARNLSKLALRALSYPELWEMTALPYDSVTSGEGIRHPLKNSNALASEIPEFIGGKTGFTDHAGGALIVVAEAPIGKLKIFIVLNSTYAGRFADMQALLEWAKTLIHP